MHVVIDIDTSDTKYMCMVVHVPVFLRTHSKTSALLYASALVSHMPMHVANSTRISKHSQPGSDLRPPRILKHEFDEMVADSFLFQMREGAFAALEQWVLQIGWPNSFAMKFALLEIAGATMSPIFANVKLQRRRAFSDVQISMFLFRPFGFPPGVHLHDSQVLRVPPSP